MEDNTMNCLEGQIVTDHTEDQGMDEKEKLETKPILKDNQGFGIVEVVLIIVVVIGLVIIFNEQITTFMNSALQKLQTTANDILS